MIEYLVESHVGGYYISKGDPDIIERYCQECGDHDRIILSFEKSNKLETFLNYFSKLVMTMEEVKEDLETGISKNDLIEYFVYRYDENRYMINSLESYGLLDRNEKIQILKMISASEKKQFEILRELSEAKKLIKRGD